jgi:hypothetical protein
MFVHPNTLIVIQLLQLMVLPIQPHHCQSLLPILLVVVDVEVKQIVKWTL